MEEREMGWTGKSWDGRGIGDVVERWNDRRGRYGMEIGWEEERWGEKMRWMAEGRGEEMERDQME